MKQRSEAESQGNHCSNDVLAANVAKTILLGCGLVDQAFLADRIKDVHPDDYALFVSRVWEHGLDIGLEHEYAKRHFARELETLLSGTTVSGDAVKGLFLSEEDCPDDRGKWFVLSDGSYLQSGKVNVGEDVDLSRGALPVREVPAVEVMTYVADRVFEAVGKDSVTLEEGRYGIGLPESGYPVVGISRKEEGDGYSLQYVGGYDENGRPVVSDCPFEDVESVFSGSIGVDEASGCVVSILDDVLDTIHAGIAREYAGQEREMLDDALSSDQIRFDDGPVVEFPGGSKGKLQAVYGCPDGVTRVQCEGYYGELSDFSDKSVAVISDAVRAKVGMMLSPVETKEQAARKGRKDSVSVSIG